MRKWILFFGLVLFFTSIVFYSCSSTHDFSPIPLSEVELDSSKYLVGKPQIKDLSYENIVFKGGGVLGIAYVGSMEVFELNGLLDGVKNVAGTSVGSITAALVAVGAGSLGLKEAFTKTNFKSIISDKGGLIGDGIRLRNKFGLHSGDEFIESLKNNIESFCGDAEITFAELEKLHEKNPNKFKKLNIVSSNLTSGLSEIFNAENTPDFPVWMAVRCSMSIPILFEPYHVNGNYYVDGALGWNYPINLFDEIDENGNQIFNPKTLGFYLERENQMDHPIFLKRANEINSFKESARAIVEFMMKGLNATHLSEKDNSRSIFINELGVNPTNFDISDEMIIGLIESGRKSMVEFLESK